MARTNYSFEKRQKELAKKKKKEEKRLKKLGGDNQEVDADGQAPDSQSGDKTDAGVGADITVDTDSQV